MSHGSDGARTTHYPPPFPPGRSYLNSLDRLFDAVLHSSIDDMQNLAPPPIAAPHVPLPPSSKRRISISGPVSPLSASFLFV